VLEAMSNPAKGDSSMNSFAMIFGHCVWIPPSPKAALIALSLFYGIGINTQPDVDMAEAMIASQYVAGGKTQHAAEKEVSALNACFASYEVPPEKQNHLASGDNAAARLWQAPPIDK
jgi:hypothetical protein